MALFMVLNELTKADVLDPNRDIAFPNSVAAFFCGELGSPTGGVPAELQKKVLKGEQPLAERPGAILPDTDLDAVIGRVVVIEGPVHLRVLAERLLTAAGVGRMGRRIRARIEAQVAALAAAGTLMQDGDILGHAGQMRAPVPRDRSDLPEKLRDLDYVSDGEVMQALVQAVLASGARVHVFTAVDHCNSECIGLHAALRACARDCMSGANRWEALQDAVRAFRIWYTAN